MPSTVEQSLVNWQAAHVAVEAAARKAVELGVRINVAVVDASGTLIAFLRMHGSPLHSAAISQDKAYTAASFGLPTGRWPGELQRHSPAVQQGLPRTRRFVMFGGGLPMRAGGTLVGGIGVSGASEDQDEQCALTGLIAAGMKE